MRGRSDTAVFLSITGTDRTEYQRKQTGGVGGLDPGGLAETRE